jgi:uncharacterized protein (TIGR02117 family)
MRRWGLRLFAVLVCLPLFYLATGLIGAVVPGPIARTESAPTLAIALASGPIHFDILLPMTEPLRKSFAFAASRGVPVAGMDAQYLVVGWGSTGFYTTTGSYADLRAANVVRAMTGDSAVLHLDVAGDQTDVPGLIWIPVSEAQLDLLAQKVLSSLKRDASGRPVPLDSPAFGQTDAFFAAKGHFSLLRTCNVWVGEVLRAAGIPFGLWTPTPQAVRLSAYVFDRS